MGVRFVLQGDLTVHLRFFLRVGALTMRFFCSLNMISDGIETIDHTLRLQLLDSFVPSFMFSTLSTNARCLQRSGQESYSVQGYDLDWHKACFAAAYLPRPVLGFCGSVLDKTDTGRHQQDENELPTSSVSQAALVMQWHLCHHRNPISERKQCVGDMACWSSILPVRRPPGMCIKSSTWVYPESEGSVH